MRKVAVVTEQGETIPGLKITDTSELFFLNSEVNKPDSHLSKGHEDLAGYTGKVIGLAVKYDDPQTVIDQVPPITGPNYDTTMTLLMEHADRMVSGTEASRETAMAQWILNSMQEESQPAPKS